jgi:hypothetical protein
MTRLIKTSVMATHAAPETDEDMAALTAMLREGAALDDDARGVLAAALDELRDHRRRAAQERLRQAAVGMHRVIIEGVSDESAEAAFAAALNKAAHYFSEYHDVAVTVLGLVALPRGGHRATLELHITPMTIRDVAHREAPDLELKHLYEADERTRKRRHEAQAAHMVHDHFLSTTGATPQFVPDFFMVDLKDADLLNFMIEKDFFKATHERSDAEEDPDPQPVPRVRVRVLHPAPDGTMESPVHNTTTNHGE